MSQYERDYLYGNDGPFTDREMLLLSSRDRWVRASLQKEMSSLSLALRRNQLMIGMFMLFCITSLASFLCMLSASSGVKDVLQEEKEHRSSSVTPLIAGKTEAGTEEA